MRKTDRNLKRVKFLKKWIPITVLLQTMLIIGMIAIIHDSKTVDVNSQALIYETITVKKVEYQSAGKTSIFYLYSDSRQYTYPDNGIFDREFSVPELTKALCVGDVLSIISIEKRLWFGLGKQVYEIVDLRDGETVYRSIEQFNAQRREARIASIIFFSVLETLFLTGVVYSFVSNNQELKFFVRRKKKRKNPAPVIAQSDKEKDN